MRNRQGRPKKLSPIKELAREQLQKGQTAFYKSDNGILGIKYRALQNKSGNKPKVVHMLSTLHTPTVVDTGKKDKDKNTIYET